MPRTVKWMGRSVSTGIFKDPVGVPVMLRALNLDGDLQADLSVHGGPHKAAYAYPSEHYGFWREEFPHMDLPWGMFGENFTTEGLLEGGVHVGDRFRIGDAEMVVTQPRLPCFKLSLKFGRSDMVRRFLASGRTGFYARVEREGRVRKGDRVELLSADRHGVSISDLLRLRRPGAGDAELLRRALRCEALPEGWKRSLLEDSAGGE